MIKTHNDLSEYYRVPPLGQHYTQRWAKEDLENERMRSGGGGSGTDTPNSGEDSTSRMLKKGAEAASGEETPFGDLTQRLVGGLMEENVMTSIEESIDATRKVNIFIAFFILTTMRYVV